MYSQERVYNKACSSQSRMGLLLIPGQTVLVLCVKVRPAPGVPGIGDWVAQGFDMHISTDRGGYPVWQCEVPLPLPEFWQYKYVRMKHGHSPGHTWEWEGGPNRSLVLQGMQGSAIVHDVFGCILARTRMSPDTFVPHLQLSACFWIF